MLYCCQETELFYGATFLKGTSWNESGKKTSGTLKHLLWKIGGIVTKFPVIAFARRSTFFILCLCLFWPWPVTTTTSRLASSATCNKKYNKYTSQSSYCGGCPQGISGGP
jgi:hypothetical protein